MIKGKYSALKGFSLFLFAIIAIMSLIAAIVTKESAFIIPGIAGFLIDSGLIVFLYSYWSGSNLTKGTVLEIKINLKK